METEIIRAGIADLPLLLSWRLRVLREVFALPADADLTALERENRRYYEQQLPAGTHTACFARDRESGDIVGCGGICYQRELPSPENRSGSCGCLMNIYTLPAWRGRGVARRVVEFLLRDARARGTEKLFLETTSAGERLYRALGFTELRGYMKL